MSQTTTEAAPGGTIEAGSDELVYLSQDQLPTSLRVSQTLRNFVDAIGRFGSWFAIPLILITAFDLGIRKTGWVQIWLVENISPYFGSTLLQELEWHSHTVLFTLVLGFGYIWNTHVRVDLVRETLKFRRKLWIEFLGLSFFLIPYISVVIYFAFVYTYDSWAINRADACAWYQCGEVSASLVGLSHRWIIKLILAFGLVVALVAGIAVWLETAIALFGPQNWRFHLSTVEWPEAEGATVEGKERLDLEKAPDQLELRAKAREERGSVLDLDQVPTPAVREDREQEHALLDWEGLFKRYVWDDRTTPYLVPVSRLNRRQADYEIMAYSLFIGVLFAVVALSAMSGLSPHGRSPVMTIYGFSVVCAAVTFHYTKATVAGFYLAATPLAGILYLMIYGIGSDRELGDTAIVAVLILLLLWYSWRVVNLTRAYPLLPEADDDEPPPRRRLFK